MNTHDIIIINREGEMAQSFAGILRETLRLRVLAPAPTE
jgi:hypothetical protein